VVVAYLEVLSGRLHERLKNPRKIFFKIAGNKATIQFGCPLGRIMEFCQCSNRLRGKTKYTYSPAIKRIGNNKENRDNEIKKGGKIVTNIHCTDMKEGENNLRTK
jgi:hypothetical protein